MDNWYKNVLVDKNERNQAPGEDREQRTRHWKQIDLNVTFEQTYNRDGRRHLSKAAAMVLNGPVIRVEEDYGKRRRKAYLITSIRNSKV